MNEKIRKILPCSLGQNLSKKNYRLNKDLKGGLFSSSFIAKVFFISVTGYLISKNPKSISSPEQNYFAIFAMRYP
jgi:hypothetical protein